MINIISEVFIQFGERAVSIFGFPIYYYALLIVLGMCLGMLVASYLMKKSKLDGFSVVDYCVWLLPLGILGARLYFFIFPYNGKPSDWSEFFNFRNGGLGIYGGVILGYITCYIIARVKKHNFFKITDCMLPGVLLAQAIGRWGNFVNQEAFGNIITNTSLQWFPYGVYIESLQEWHQATFFYESVCTFLGFIICLILFNNKHYRTGWTTAFYGIYYGIVRLVIESMRTDSLYLWLGTYQTNIKISQAVSVITIVLGVWKLTVIYRSELLKFYRS
ncbi:MAG: prolipoprotein diacylglyceryl transferase, partial [Clostridia bacterium]